MKKLNELNVVEFVEVAKAKAREVDFKSWCESHNVDYEDVNRL